ncbi:hypothetical protein D9M71_600280 [compost metagenome]
MGQLVTLHLTLLAEDAYHSPLLLGEVVLVEQRAEKSHHDLAGLQQGKGKGSTWNLHEMDNSRRQALKKMRILTTNPVRPAIPLNPRRSARFLGLGQMILRMPTHPHFTQVRRVRRRSLDHC